MCTECVTNRRVMARELNRGKANTKELWLNETSLPSLEPQYIYKMFSFQIVCAFVNCYLYDPHMQELYYNLYQIV